MAQKIDKDSFLLHRDHKAIFEALTTEQAGILILGIFEYEETGSVPEFDGDIRMAFISIKQWLDKNRAKYEEVCRVNAENGSKGGRPPKNPKNRTVTNGYEKTERLRTQPKKADHDHDYDEQEYIDNSTAQAHTRTREGEPGDEEAAQILADKLVDRFGVMQVDWDEAVSVMGDLVLLYGMPAAYDAVRVTGIVKNPPDNPLAYIRTVLSEWKTSKTGPFSNTLYLEKHGGAVNTA